MAASDDCGHIRFFSFSLIEGYISLVMDVQTQQRWAGPCVDITGGPGGSVDFLLSQSFTGVVPIGEGLSSRSTARWRQSGDWNHSPKAICPPCLTPVLASLPAPNGTDISLDLAL